MAIDNQEGVLGTLTLCLVSSSCRPTKRLTGGSTLLRNRDIRRCAFSALWFVIYFQAALALGLASEGKGAQRERTTFGPFELGGTNYPVIMDSVPIVPVDVGNTDIENSHRYTLDSASVQDSSGSKVWERAFRPPDAPQARTVGTAYKVLGETGEGIVLEFGTLAPSRINAGWFVVLARRGGHLEQISREVRFYGSMEHIPDAGYEQRHLVSGDKIRYQFWMGSYYLLCALQVNFQAYTAVPLCTRRCTLPVLAQPRPLGTDLTIQLFDGPAGHSHRAHLRNGSRVEFIDAHVDDVGSMDAATSGHNQRPWLHVRIDGHDCWTPDIDAESLGLQEIKRADEP